MTFSSQLSYSRPAFQSYNHRIGGCSIPGFGDWKCGWDNTILGFWIWDCIPKRSCFLSSGIYLLVCIHRLLRTAILSESVIRGDGDNVAEVKEKFLKWSKHNTRFVAVSGGARPSRPAGHCRCKAGQPGQWSFSAYDGWSQQILQISK